jgi:hypothetical protein
MVARWEAERPVGEAELPAAALEQAAKSTLPLAMAKALHRYAVQVDGVLWAWLLVTAFSQLTSY